MKRLRVRRLNHFVQPVVNEVHATFNFENSGFRGLYKSKDGTVINSDLNGSANILRKALPDAYTKGIRPDFDTVRIVKNPEIASVLANQRKQASRQRNAVMSKSKAKHFRKKCTA